MTETIIPILSEFEKLLEEVRKLRARVIELTTQRDDLLYHICPSLQAKYDEKIGSVERELLAAQMYLKEKQRIIEILQAQLNRQEKPSMKEAEKKAHAEFSAYEEELKRRRKKPASSGNTGSRRRSGQSTSRRAAPGRKRKDQMVPVQRTLGAGQISQREQKELGTRQTRQKLHQHRAQVMKKRSISESRPLMGKE